MKADRACLEHAKKALRYNGVTVAVPGLREHVAAIVAVAITDERARLAGMLLGAHEAHGPLNDAQVACLADIFEGYVIGDDGQITVPEHVRNLFARGDDVG